MHLDNEDVITGKQYLEQARYIKLELNVPSHLCIFVHFLISKKCKNGCSKNQSMVCVLANTPQFSPSHEKPSSAESCFFFGNPVSSHKEC